jgi:anaerobic magnesium-protoporphyrin IX monomethyl ester cyclase
MAKIKVIFANSPVMRYKDQIVTDFSIEKEKKIRFLRWMKKLGVPRIMERAYNHIIFRSGYIRFGQRAGSRWPFTSRKPTNALNFPFIMNYSASYLRSRGYDAETVDAIADECFSYSGFIGKLKEKKPDIVVLECCTPTIDIDILMAKEISNFAEVALAGPHLSLKCSEVQKQAPFVKYFLKGEYILSSLKMAETRKKGVYESEVVRDIDSIPFPFRDYSSSYKYYDPSMCTKFPQLQIWGSKGCPFHCTFCMWPQTMYKGIVSLRSPKKIIAEIKENLKKKDYKSIFFDDDTFNIGTERISELSDELKKIGLPWTMMGRLDCSPLWLLEKMIDCGCVGLRFGVETFDKGVLKNVNKGLENTNFLETIRQISKKYPKIMIHLTMMENLPGQTKEIHANDMKILKEMGYEEVRGFPFRSNEYRHFQCSSCVPFPGTKMHTDLKLDGKETLKDYISYDGSK